MLKEVVWKVDWLVRGWFSMERRGLCMCECEKLYEERYWED